MGAPSLAGRRLTNREANDPAATMDPRDTLDLFRHKARRANQALMCCPDDGSWAWAPEPYVRPGFGALLVCDTFHTTFCVFPSGLAQPLPDLNWVWHCDAPLLRSARRYSPYYLGCARDVARACQRLGVDPQQPRAVAAEDIHGTCVFQVGPNFQHDRRDWRMVQARSIW